MDFVDIDTLKVSLAFALARGVGMVFCMIFCVAFAKHWSGVWLTKLEHLELSKNISWL